jgi:hypothetical protein
MVLLGWVCAVLCAWAPWASAQPAQTTLTRASELRADKLPAAPVVTALAPGAALRVLSVEGGWVWVETASLPARRGWLRTSDVASPAGGGAAGQGAASVGVRSLVPRSSRHALVIGVSRYADPAISPLPGARIDRESATQMALAMQVPERNIRYLQDEQATGEAIRRAIRELDAAVQEGDRVFIHYSGHGTRFNDPASGGCVEALLAHDGVKTGTITNREMAQLLAPITRKTDKLFVMYDACHSGGVIAQEPGLRTRGVLVPGDEGRLRPKFAATTDECGRPVNVKTRNLLVEATDKGTLPQDIIHVSSSRDNEISFDDEDKGGLATQFMRDCMLRDARDRDGSGAISMEEIRACAQEKIEKRMRNDANFKAHNLVLTGNAGFVPAWFGGDQLALQSPAAPTASTASTMAAAPPAAAPPPAALTGAQALEQMFEQRDAKRAVRVTVAKQRLRIGQDPLEFAVQSDRPGYLYVAMAGSDNRSLQLLFPNDLDNANRIEAGQAVSFPRTGWRVRAGGPSGTNSLLVMVADGPRDLAALAGTKAGPFMMSLNDTAGRAALGALMTRSRPPGEDQCANPATRKGLPACSDAFGAALFKVEEFQ